MTLSHVKLVKDWLPLAVALTFGMGDSAVFNSGVPMLFYIDSALGIDIDIHIDTDRSMCSVCNIYKHKQLLFGV
jgi:hypothetical protein